MTWHFGSKSLVTLYTCHVLIDGVRWRGLGPMVAGGGLET